MCAAGDRVITLERWGGMLTSWGATWEGGGYWPGTDVARRIVLRGPIVDGGPSCKTHASVPVSGWVQDLNGGMHPFREKGKGVPMLEGHGRWHHRIPNKEELHHIMETLS